MIKTVRLYKGIALWKRRGDIYETLVSVRRINEKIYIYHAFYLQAIVIHETDNEPIDMIDESKKTTKRKVLELLDSTSRPKDDAEIIAAVAIDEKELRQIIKAINNEHYTYEESLLGMGLVKEWKRLFREPGFTITDKGRYVLLYIRKKELEEML